MLINKELWEQKRRIDCVRLNKKLLSRDEVMSLPEGTIAQYQSPLHEGAEPRKVVHKWDSDELLVYLMPHHPYTTAPLSWIYLINHLTFDTSGNRYTLPAVWVNDEPKLNYENGGGNEIFATMLW
mgnify:CR=1 FL=1